MEWVRPIVLSGKHAVLQPLDLKHVSDSQEAVADGESWRLWYTRVPEPQFITSEVSRRLSLQQSSSMLPFAVVDNATGRAIGMTSYMNSEPMHQRIDVVSKIGPADRNQFRVQADSARACVRVTQMHRSSFGPIR